MAQQVEEHGGHAVLAVVFVSLDPGAMVAIGDAALADVELKQTHAPLDGQIQLGVLHSCFARQDQR